jgi:hypothetical protein
MRGDLLFNAPAATGRIAPPTGGADARDSDAPGLCETA